MTRNWALLVVLVLPLSSATAGERDPASASPVLSPAGKKRLLENSEILDSNIRDTKKNVDVSDRNIKTLRSELTELDSLEREHQELKQKHLLYISGANKEIEKNDKAMHELEQWEAKNPNPTDEAKKMKLESVKNEIAERERWKTDAKTKIEKVNALLQSTLKNLREIEARRGPLKTQLQSWTDRAGEFAKQLTELSRKKAQLDKMVSK